MLVQELGPAIVAASKRIISVPLRTPTLSKLECLASWDKSSSPYCKKKGRKFIYKNFAEHSTDNLAIVKRIQPTTYHELTKNATPSVVEKIDPFSVKLEPKKYTYGVSRRVGAIGLKQGMASYFDAATGRCEPATVLYLDTNTTLKCRIDPLLPADKAIQEVGAGLRGNPRRENGRIAKYYYNCGVPVKAFRQSFVVSKDAILPPGSDFKF